MCFLVQICAQADKEIRNKELKIADVHKPSYRQNTLDWTPEQHDPKSPRDCRTNVTAGSDSPFDPGLDSLL